MSQKRLKKSKKKALKAMSNTELKKRVDVLNKHRKQHHKNDRAVLKSKDKKSNRKIIISQIRLYESRRLTGDSGSSADEQQGKSKHKKVKKKLKKEKVPPPQRGKFTKKTNNDRVNDLSNWLFDVEDWSNKHG
eukprot:9053_1